MANRIATRTLRDSIAQAITASQQRVMKLQQQLSDGRAVQRPSDDPVRASMGMWYRSRVQAQDQYVRNLEGAAAQLSARDSTLSQIQDILGQVRVLQTSGSEDSIGADGRAAIAAQVNQQLESLVELGNTRYAGAFIFGGSRSTEPPLVAQRDATGRIVQVALNPHRVTGAWTRVGGPDVSLTLQANAADLFGKDGALFRLIEGLRDALAADQGDQVRALAGPLEQAQEKVDLASTAVGALINRADAMKSAAAQASTLYEEGRSEAEDLPTAQAVVDYQSAQTALQAALQSGSQILKLSLLDYLS